MTLMLHTPHHVYITELRQGHSETSEMVVATSGVLVQTSGVWHKIAGSLKEFADMSDPDSLKELHDCRHLGDEVSNAQLTANTC